MCGIAGIIHHNNNHDVVPEVHRILKYLAYRGYDSSGISALNTSVSPHTIVTKKVLGHPNNLQIPCNMRSHIAIGHNRWAAIGDAKDINNVHPINTENISLVHNGNIENYQSLAAKYGFTLKSQTDSAVIAQLIEYFLTHDNLSPMEAVSQAVAELVGSFAILVIFKNIGNGSAFIAAIRASSLVFSYTESRIIVASDPNAISHLTEEIVHLQDNDIALLDHENKGYIINNINEGLGIHRKTSKIQILKEDMLSTNNLNTNCDNMFAEMSEQPESMMRTLLHLEKDQINLSHVAELLRTKYILLVCCGSSYFAAIIAKYWFESYLYKSVKVEIASEFLYNNAYLDDSYVVIFISQSGQTADTLQSIRYARTRCRTVSLTNVMHNPIAELSHYPIFTKAGAEIGVASTKTFTTQLFALLYIIHYTCNGNIGVNFLDIIQTAEKVIKEYNTLFCNISKVIAKTNNLLLIGRHASYGVALEGALKLKELSYIHAEAIPAGELKHGSLALIDKNVITIAMAPTNAYFSKLLTNVEEIRARQGKVILFTDEDSLDKVTNIANHTMVLPRTNTFSMPFIYTIPLQYISYYTAKELNNNPNMPRNLAKSVTVE